jgi:hypothetical protein
LNGTAKKKLVVNPSAFVCLWFCDFVCFGCVCRIQETILFTWLSPLSVQDQQVLIPFDCQVMGCTLDSMRIFHQVLIIRSGSQFFIIFIFLRFHSYHVLTKKFRKSKSETNRLMVAMKHYYLFLFYYHIGLKLLFLFYYDKN